ncbi:hypothetical protein BY996DRAFT_8696321 [Phakopsora pachyrhizi]|nr:hypothetical protein BY996DRAFT_8696973 [Phakopsora pachyrhizi]KAI8443161.1 hypothetical protein BY996DRAFT_8696321 [Phakopsora pachyrhizi]
MTMVTRVMMEAATVLQVVGLVVVMVVVESAEVLVLVRGLMAEGLRGRVESIVLVRVGWIRVDEDETVFETVRVGGGGFDRIDEESLEEFEFTRGEGEEDDNKLFGIRVDVEEEEEEEEIEVSE